MRKLAAVLAVMFLLVASNAGAQTGTVLFQPERAADDTSSRPPESSAPPAVTGKHWITIQVFADGNIRKAVSEASVAPAAGTTDEGSDAVARLGLGKINHWTGETWSGVVSVASTSNRVDRDFIANVLAPGTGAGFHSGLLEYRSPAKSFTGKYARLKRALVRDWHLYGTVGASDWDSAGTPIRAVLFGFSALRVFTPISNQLTNSRVGLSLEIGPSMRIIGGDVTLARHQQFRSDAVGSTKNSFFGVEVGMQIYVGDIAASLQFYRFAKGDAEVAGLTRTQMLASVNVRAPLFSGHPN